LQEKVAQILFRFHALIENNTRRIAILEEMAQAIYREWFVHFRFPGHENVKMVESELGPIPAGWEGRTLGDIAVEERRGIDPNAVDPGTPYVGLEHIPRRSITLQEWDSAASAGSRKYEFRRGEILFGKIRPYFHKVVVAPADGICSTDAIVIRSKSEDAAGLTLAVVSSREFVDYATQTSQGTKMPRADWKVLSEYPVAVPPQVLQSRFEAYMSQTVELLQNLAAKNRALNATRDLLLPKLVSGEIDVSELDIDTGELVA
jgi:type I restriction enzyme S subunit